MQPLIDYLIALPAGDDATKRVIGRAEEIELETGFLRPDAALGERWLRNMLLNKWLDYCSERGHRFTVAAATSPVRAADAPSV